MFRIYRIFNLPLENVRTKNMFAELTNVNMFSVNKKVFLNLQLT